MRSLRFWRLGRRSLRHPLVALEVSSPGLHVRTVTVVTIAFLIGCARADSVVAEDTGVLALIDDVVVRETDSLFVGRPVDMIALRDGSVVITDVAQSRVLLIDRAGEIRMTIGRKGRGPGEMVSPNWLALEGDSILHVKDGGKKNIQTYRLGTGDFVSERPLPPHSGRLVTTPSGQIAVAAFDLDSNSSVVVPVADGSVRREGAIPALARKLPMLLGAFANQAVLVDADSLHSISEYEDALISSALGRKGEYVSTPIPKSGRRGIVSSDFEKMVSDPSRAAELAYRHSIPLLLARMPSGDFAFAAYDVDPVGASFVGRFYLTLLDRSRAQVCVDAPVPAPEDPPARLTVLGDTLIVLVQEASDSARSRTSLRRFRIDRDKCRWQTLRPSTRFPQ